MGRRDMGDYVALRGRTELDGEERHHAKDDSADAARDKVLFPRSLPTQIDDDNFFVTKLLAINRHRRRPKQKLFFGNAPGRALFIALKRQPLVL
jgi:hypothetical protein